MDGLFYFMNKYIFIRDYEAFGWDMKKGDIIQQDENGLPNIPERAFSFVLKMDMNIFIAVFHSLAYNSWLAYYSSDKDEEQNELYPGLRKSPETVIMYLMELGVKASTIMNFMYGPGNKYQEYLYLVQEFGKMV